MTVFVKDLVLIETYWNVNQVLSEQFVNFLFVLIETYWNVNEEDQVLPELLELVLIETYWNVNAESTGLSPAFWRY